MVGGSNAAGLQNVSELVSLTNIQSLPELPIKVGSSCTIKIDEKRIMVTGGYHGDYSDSTFIYDFDTMTWTTGNQFDIISV